MTSVNHRRTMSPHLDSNSPKQRLFRKNRVSESKFVFVFPSRRDVRFRISAENLEPERSHPTQQIWLPPLHSACGHYLLTSLYVNNILIGISDWRWGAGETGPKKLWIHVDKARRHRAKVSINFMALNEMKKAPRLPYSPDLAPLDVFPFGYVERNLRGYCAENLSELLVRIQIMSRATPGETLVEVCSSG
jgi:hypothetical protein